jgi:hypothetical protein
MVAGMRLRDVVSSSWLAMLVTATGVSAIMLGSGVQAGQLGRYALYLALAVALPGVFAWRLLLTEFHLRPDDAPPTWFEDLSLGTIFGFGTQLPVYVVGLLFGAPLLFGVLPVLVLIVSVATPLGRRTWALPTRRLDVRAAWALAGVVLYGLSWLARNVFSLRPLSLAAFQTPSVDETFHQALISELMHRFPPQSPYLLGTPMDYHWFSHAQLAATRWTTGIELTVLIRQLFPAAVLTLTVLGLGAVALRLSGRTVAAFIAPALLVAGGFHLLGPDYATWAYTESYLSKRLMSSPSQTYGFAMALPATLLILEVLRPDRRPSRLIWVSLALSLVALAGAKATFLPIFACGALALLLVRLVFRRTLDRTAAALTGLLVIATAFAQLVLFGGNSGALDLEPFKTVGNAVRNQGIADTPGARIAMTATLLIGWLLYGMGVLGLTREQRWRDSRAVWMLWCIPPGIVVALMFFRSGLSQLWFQRSTAGLVVLLSAWGLATLLPVPLTTRTALRLSAVAGAAGLAAFAASAYLAAGKATPQRASLDGVVATALAPVVVLLVVELGRRLSRSGAVRAPSLAVVLVFVLGLGTGNVWAFANETLTREAAPRRSSGNLFAPGGAVAARWLERHSAPDAVVATNEHCREPNADVCDNRNFWISAYTERRVVVEGWGYTAVTNSSAPKGSVHSHAPVPYPRRLALNDAAFERPSAATLSRLVEAYGVDWLFVAKSYPADLKGLAELDSGVAKTFENRHYAVFRVLTRSPR